MRPDRLGRSQSGEGREERKGAELYCREGVENEEMIKRGVEKKNENAPVLQVLWLLKANQNCEGGAENVPLPTHTHI